MNKVYTTANPSDIHRFLSEDAKKKIAFIEKVIK